MENKEDNIFKTEKEFTNYAEKLATHIINSKKPKKLHYVFLKNLNDMLAASLDNRAILELEKEISNLYNNKLKVNQKKTKSNLPSLKIGKANKSDIVDDGEVYDNAYEVEDEYDNF